MTVKARKYVLAAGGLETTRILLSSVSQLHPDGLGNHSDHLGRWYQTHLSGRIAQARFSTPPELTIYGHERDADGVYVRRRFTLARSAQLREELPNVVGWLVNPPLADASHRSGVLSFAHLALTSPLGKYFAPEAIRASLTDAPVRSPTRAHVRNVMENLGVSARFAFGFGYRRFVPRRRAPGFFTYSAANSYPLQYHSEQAPRSDSRVRLGEDRDRVGMRRLRIDLQFSQRDIDGVLAAHERWDAHLRDSGAGHLEYIVADPETEVWRSAHGGAHQIGTTRMSGRPEDGVVDRELAVHGVGNLHVASSSTFVTSSQANSTFMIVAFAVRLADHLRGALQGARE